MTLNDLFVKSGGRRFLLAVATLISDSVLVWFGKIDSGAYSTVVLGVVAVYVAGNVYQKRIERNREIQ